MRDQIPLRSAVVAAMFAFPTVAAAQIVEIHHLPPKAGTQTDIGTTRIVVTGSTDKKYDKVVTTSLDTWVSVKAPDKPPRDKEKLSGSITVDGENAFYIGSGFPGSSTVYKLSFPYKDPRSTQVANQRISPVEICNDKLASLSGAAREDFLKNGGNVLRTDAYVATAKQSWQVRKQGSIFVEIKDWKDDAGIPAVVACQRLAGPKPRTQTSTSSGGGAPPAKKMEPTIVKVTLRGEPQKWEPVGGQSCPTQVRLYGFIEVRRAFQGKSLFVGPSFFTPPQDLVFNGAGTRNVFGTYNVKWPAQGAQRLAVGAGGAATPRKQTIELRMNIADSGGKVLEIAKTSETLTCKLVGAPTNVRQ